MALRSRRLLALLETPSGFALFYVAPRLFDEPHTIWAYFTAEATCEHLVRLKEFTKVDDKSAARRLFDSPGKDLTALTQGFLDGRTEFVVDGEELKHVLETRLRVQCFYEKYVVGVLMWGLRNVLCYYVREEREKITPQYLLPPCQGIQDLMEKFGIEVPTEEIDPRFIGSAGDLFRYDYMLERCGRKLRERCEKLVPGISAHIEDDLLYGEAMAKIVALDWCRHGISLRLQKLQRKENMLHETKLISTGTGLYPSLIDLRRLPGMTQIKLEKVKKMAADRCSKVQNMQTAAKRSHQLVAEASEGTTNQDEGFVDASAGGAKKARAAE